ncbi:MAG: hypothetical protein LBC40_00335 [Dysgonamonadaceae bacterium]|jgi:hypothetical protein|nr:hypothetical protein [Dysgonamonadaceae bacterium]
MVNIYEKNISIIFLLLPCYLFAQKNVYPGADEKVYPGRSILRGSTTPTNFPNGLDPVYKKAKANNIRLGLWGGPDGFGDTAEEAAGRKNMLVSLCRDYNWALFKFDAVCGPLRREKEDDFIDMMEQGYTIYTGCFR